MDNGCQQLEFEICKYSAGTSNSGSVNSLIQCYIHIACALEYTYSLYIYKIFGQCVIIGLCISIEN